MPKVTKKLIKENPIKAAAQLAHSKNDSLGDPKLALKKIKSNNKEIIRLTDLIETLAPLESYTLNQLKGQKNKLLELNKKLSTSLVPSPSSLNSFDLSCLSWRDDNGFPRLVPFDPDKGTCTIGYSCRRGWDRNYHYAKIKGLPSEFKSYYDDVYKKLAKLRSTGKGIQISTRFTGVIPEDIRYLLQGAQEVFDKVYVLAEVSDWKVTKTPSLTPIVDGDPLIIGRFGKQFLLIKEFDLTTIEKMAADRSKGFKSS